MSNSKLTPTDWVQAGFRALTKGGPKAVNVEAIARALKVSKGSFYWHFETVGALRSAMIAHWQDQATGAVIRGLDRPEITASERLHLLIARITAMDLRPYGGPQAEAAIRDWARYDPEVAAALTEVDAQRIAFVADLFEGAGHSEAVAARHARLLYAGLIGTESLSFRGLGDPAQDLSALLDLLLRR